MFTFADIALPIGILFVFAAMAIVPAMPTVPNRGTTVRICVAALFMVIGWMFGLASLIATW